MSKARCAFALLRALTRPSCVPPATSLSCVSHSLPFRLRSSPPPPTSPTYVSLALYELEDSQNPFSVASAHTQTKSVTCALFEPPRSRFLPRNLRYSVNWPSSFGFLHSPLHPGDFCAFGPTCRCYESSSSWGVPFATKHLNRSLSTSN